MAGGTLETAAGSLGLAGSGLTEGASLGTTSAVSIPTALGSTFLIADGLANVSAGWERGWTDEAHDTLTHAALKAATGSDSFATFLHTVLCGASSLQVAWSQSSNVAPGKVLPGARVAPAKAAEGRAYWKHAQEQMAKRGITAARVEEALSGGRVVPGNVPGRSVYELPSRASSSGRGLQVVVEDASGEVVTVIDRGSKFK